MSDKPIIFISHSSKDGDIVNILKDQIEVAMQEVVVFETSHPEAIPVSKKWFDEIVDKLDIAQALIVVVSPSSKASVWVNFEIGYFWKINEDRKKQGMAEYPIFPLSLHDAPLFGPLTILQGKALDKVDQLSSFFQILCGEFGGDLSRADLGEVISKIENESKIEFGYLPGNFRNWRG